MPSINTWGENLTNVIIGVADGFDDTICSVTQYNFLIYTGCRELVHDVAKTSRLVVYCHNPLLMVIGIQCSPSDGYNINGRAIDTRHLNNQLSAIIIS